MNRAKRHVGVRNRLFGVGHLVLFYFAVFLMATGIVWVGQPYRVAKGAIYFVCGAALGVATIRFWARMLSGIFGVAALGAWITVASGHWPNVPESHVPRSLSAVALAACVASSVIASKLKLRYSAIDRAGLFGVMLALAIVVSSEKTVIPGLALAVICLLALRLINSRSRRCEVES